MDPWEREANVGMTSVLLTLSHPANVPCLSGSYFTPQPTGGAYTNHLVKAGYQQNSCDC